jgi:type VI secretion system secreted protein VgrG
MTVPDIIKQVFADHPVADFTLELTSTYRKWTYCVQYRETDFNFVSRLMEQEGIYYYFEHSDGKHMLMLCDSPGAHQPFPGYAKIPFRPTDLRQEDRQYVWDLVTEQEVQPGAYALTDFDFTAPRKSLRATAKITRQHAHPDYEVFDYPGEYDVLGDGQRYAKLRNEEQQAAYEAVKGQSDAQGVCPGCTFELVDCPREDQNRELLVVSASYQVESDEYDSDGTGATGPDFLCNFSAMDATEPFRPARLTPKPLVQGPQTAIVVGPSGEEIYTDQYGRVKVQFHWDRYGESNEKSSCWVRVSQPWAGKAWGGITIPRIGQEVIIEFLEGDPDQPIITGRVYNGDNPVPYALPANKTQSGMKSRSSPGGSPANFNEIRMEDKKGSEQLYIHAEKNEDIVVENDKTEAVGHDETRDIGNDTSLHVGRDKTETVDRHKIVQVAQNHTETVSGAMSVTVAKTLTEMVGINYSETVGGAMELTVGAALAITVGAVMSETVGGAKTEAVGGSKSESIGSNKTVTVVGNLTQSVKKDCKVTIDKDLTEEIKGKHQEQVKQDYMLQAKKIQLVADDEITLKTGSAEIVMKKNGDITLNGKKITVKGSGDVVIKGSKVTAN